MESMSTEEWLTEESGERPAEYPASADLWQVEQLLHELLTEIEHARRPALGQQGTDHPAVDIR